MTSSTTEEIIDVSDDVEAYVSRCTVGFMNTTTGASMGSGTLVRYGNLMGVLTCAHALVAMEQAKVPTIGFLCFPVRNQRQNRRIQREFTQDCYIYGDPKDWKGPDIGFLRLPTLFAKELEAIANFVNLELQIAASLEPAAKDPIEAVSGVVAQMSDKPLDAPPTKLTTMDIGALLNLGRTARRSPVTGKDRLYFRPRAAEDFVLPSSYRGTSGGGSWRIGLRPGSTREKLLFERRLIGVAYYETRQGKIICHGPTGIYGDLLGKITSLWPDECPQLGA